MTNSKPTFWPMLFVAALVVAFDQASKLVALKYLPLHEPIPVFDFFNLTLTFNRGVAFGMFSDATSPWREIFLGSSWLLAAGVVAYLALKEYRTNPVALLALGAIAGGAIGNLIDRVRLGAVVDFFDFYYDIYHYPAFNIADSAITLGVVTLLLWPGKK